MNIYSPELKGKIVHEYFERKDSISISELSRQHGIDPRRVGEWIRNYRLRGKIITQPTKRKFSQKFKEVALPAALLYPKTGRSSLHPKHVAEG